MAIRVRARSNESINQMLRRFKKLCEKEGLTKDIKRRQYFEKPSERRRRAQRKSVARFARPSTGGPSGGRDSSSSSGPGGASGPRRPRTASRSSRP